MCRPSFSRALSFSWGGGGGGCVDHHCAEHCFLVFFWWGGGGDEMCRPSLCRALSFFWWGGEGGCVDHHCAEHWVFFGGADGWGWEIQISSWDCFKGKLGLIQQVVYLSGSGLVSTGDTDRHRFFSFRHLGWDNPLKYWWTIPNTLLSLRHRRCDTTARLFLCHSWSYDSRYGFSHTAADGT